MSSASASALASAVTVALDLVLAMETQRVVIAQLFRSVGIELADSESTSGTSIDPGRVCRPFLVENNVCPSSLFEHTRLEGVCAPALCPRIHARHPLLESDGPDDRTEEIERETLAILHRCVSVLNARVEKEQRALASKLRSLESDADLRRLDDAISRASTEADTLADEGEIDAAAAASRQVAALRQEKSQKLASMNSNYAQNLEYHRKAYICTSCAAKLSALDAESRLQDHFGGKQHIGAARCREVHKKLLEKYGEAALHQPFVSPERRRKREREAVASAVAGTRSQASRPLDKKCMRLLGSLPERNILSLEDALRRLPSAEQQAFLRNFPPQSPAPAASTGI